MAFLICTHDAWGVVPVGEFATLAEAQEAFVSLCQDPWYKRDGSVRGLELLESGTSGQPRRLQWFALQLDDQR